MFPEGGNIIYCFINIKLNLLRKIKNYWNFNGKNNLLENEDDEQQETIFETNSFNLLKNYYNYEIEN